MDQGSKLTKKGHQVRPERVEQSDGGRDLLAEAERASLAVGATGSGGRARRKIVGDEVHEHDCRAVVGESLNAFDEADGVNEPVDLAVDTAERLFLLLGGVDLAVGTTERRVLGGSGLDQVALESIGLLGVAGHALLDGRVVGASGLDEVDVGSWGGHCCS